MYTFDRSEKGLEFKMKNVIRFIGFIIYSTTIFFLPNNRIILLFLILNLCILLVKKLSIKKVFNKSIKILPFIIFTFIINILLDDFYNALWIGIKLFIVCNITIIYSETTNITRFSRNNKNTLFSA